MRAVGRLAGVLPLTVLAAGWVFAAALPAATPGFRGSYRMESGDALVVDNPLGNVRITGWDRPELRVEASGARGAKPARVMVKRSAGRVTIRTEYADAGADAASVAYRILAPRRTTLENVRLLNGELSIQGMVGAIRAEALNGGITALDLEGRAELSTVNGRLEAAFGKVSPEKPILLSSVNGLIRLTLPAEAAASLEAHNVTGGIDAGVGVVTRDSGGHTVTAVVNQGGAPISLRNVNGGISVRSAWRRGRRDVPAY